MMDIEFSEDYVIGLQTENRRLEVKLSTAEDEREGYRQHFEAARIRIDQLNAKVAELKQQIQTPMLAKAINERDEARDRNAELELVDIVFDGPSGPESGRFVEVENQSKKSIRVGKWLERDDGYWVLRLTVQRGKGEL